MSPIKIRIPQKEGADLSRQGCCVSSKPYAQDRSCTPSSQLHLLHVGYLHLTYHSNKSAYIISFFFKPCTPTFISSCHLSTVLTQICSLLLDLLAQIKRITLPASPAKGYFCMYDCLCFDIFLKHLISSKLE